MFPKKMTFWLAALSSARQRLAALFTWCHFTYCRNFLEKVPHIFRQIEALNRVTLPKWWHCGNYGMFSFSRFWQNFCESNDFTNNEIIKALNLTKFFSVRVNCSIFHNTHWKNISSNRLFSDSSNKNVAFTKFLSKKCKSKFP